MSYVKVSSKYQITIPRSVREALGLNAGDKLYVVREGDKLVLRAFRRIENPTKVLYGSVKSEKDAVEAVRSFRAVGGRS
ncbi:MAG: AbrB/MazE/SpoVT family DNA-binding domain-containing protein [Candidatus Bathyarchaeia archaeon]